MIETLAERANGDAVLLRRGRHLNTVFLLEIGETSYLIRIVDGRVARVDRGPFVQPSWVFALRADREAWETFWQRLPPPGFNDLFALVRRGRLRIEGDLHPFMANLLYMKRLLELPRGAGE